MRAGERRILVTGGAGFIGAVLTRALIALGAEVHLLLRPARPSTRLLDLTGRFTSHPCDLLDAHAVRRAVSACRPHTVFHLAAEGVTGAATEPNSIVARNLQAAENLLAALRSVGYRRLVYAGSGAEYGPHDDAISEDAPPEPRTPYAMAKAAVARLCHDEMRAGNAVTIVRIFAAYGPGESASRLFPYVMECCRRGFRPQLSAGHQRRDFIHVADVVDLMIAALEPAAAGKVLHAASGRHHSVREAVERILKICGGASADFGRIAMHQGEPMLYAGSIDRTVALTGWRPRLELTAGIERMWRSLNAQERLVASAASFPSPQKSRSLHAC